MLLLVSFLFYCIYYLSRPYCLLFTENETNKSKLFNAENDSPYVKDGINDYIVHGVKTAVNPEPAGTKTSAPITQPPSRKIAYH